MPRHGRPRAARSSEARAHGSGGSRTCRGGPTVCPARQRQAGFLHFGEFAPLSSRRVMMARMVAVPGSDAYSGAMRLHVLRRWFTLCIVAALTLGLATHGYAAASMAAKMAAVSASSGMTEPDGTCDGCGGDAMLGGGCFAACTGAVAILPVSAPFAATDRADAVARLPDPGLGRSSQPDPYPPRSIVLN